MIPSRLLFFNISGTGAVIYIVKDFFHTAQGVVWLGDMLSSCCDIWEEPRTEMSVSWRVFTGLMEAGVDDFFF